MTELKTLKDLKNISTNRVLNCDSNILKQEAIKHLNYLLKKDNHDHTGRNCEYCKTYMSDVIFIYKFFNITEEDLK